MKNNKLICIVLALLVCLTIAVSASATTELETNLTFKLESSLDSSKGPATTVAPEEVFTVNVVLEKNTGVKLYISYLNYNAENLDLVKFESKNDNVTVEKSLAKDGRLVITVGDVNALIGEGKVISDTGVVAQLTFKVKATDKDITSGNEISLEVGSKNVVDANGNIGAEAEVTVSEVEPIVPTIVSKDHKCDESNLIAHEGKDATCTEAGYTAYGVCPVCNKEIGKQEVAAKGHEMDAGTVTTAATCTEKGVKTFKCTREGCTHTTTEEVAATGHTYGEWKVTTAATTEAEGVETRECSGCGAKETRSIEKLAPTEPSEPTTPAEPTDESDNTVLIVVIIAVVVLAGGGVAAYFVLKNKKK